MGRFGWILTGLVIVAGVSVLWPAVGILKLAETGARDVSLKVSGWIDELYADQMGMHVRAGQPLFAVYSPEFQVAAEELIAAVKSEQIGGDAARDQARRMAESARR